MKVYIDPYIDQASGVLKNKQGSTDNGILEKMEADFTSVRLEQLASRPLVGEFNFEHLCKIHEAIFQDIYEWAGLPRIINIEKEENIFGGLSVEYADFNEIQKKAGIILSKMNGIQ